MQAIETRIKELNSDLRKVNLQRRKCIKLEEFEAINKLHYIITQTLTALTVESLKQEGAL